MSSPASTPVSPKARKLPVEQSVSWRSLFNFTTNEHRGHLCISIALVIASGLLEPCFAILLGDVFNQFTEFGARRVENAIFEGQIARLSKHIALLGLGTWLVDWLFLSGWLVFGELQALVARTRIYHGLIQKPMVWYDARRPGMTAPAPRLQSLVAELQLATSQPFGYSAQCTVKILASLALALYFCWKLTLVILSTVPVTALFLLWISKRMQPAIAAQQNGLAAASRISFDAFKNIALVKCFNGQLTETNKFLHAIQDAANHYSRQTCANASQVGFVRFVTFAMFVQGFWYGYFLVSHGKSSTGHVITTFWSCLTATQAMDQIMPHLMVLEKGKAAGTHLVATLLPKDGFEAGPGERGLLPSKCEGEICFQNVSFAYPARSQRRVLDGFSATFAAGKMTFIIGQSGSGKSTIGQILLRFYPILAGSVTLDNVPLTCLDVEWLRRSITLVEQSSALFEGTVFDNIVLGKGVPYQSCLKDIDTAVDFAALQQTINNMPQGRDTWIGPCRNNLSGGQQQRIALARARIRDSPILVLDEPTSALDHVNRSLILSAIRIWRKEKTTIIISHDMSQIHRDDHVVLLRDGKLAEHGALGSTHSTHPSQRKSRGKDDPIKKHPGVVDFSRSNERTPRKPHCIETDAKHESHDANELPLCNDQSAPLSPLPSSRISVSQHLERPSMARTFRSSLHFTSPTGIFSPFLSSAASLSPIDISSPRDTWPQHEGDRRVTVACALPRESVTTDQRRYLSELNASHIPQGAIELLDWTVFTPLKSRFAPSQRRKRKSSYSSLSASSDELLFGHDKAQNDRYLESREPLLTDNEKSEASVGSLSTLKILLTVPSALSSHQRLYTLLGMISSITHALITPVFSYVFSLLLSTFFQPPNLGSSKALEYSLSILALALVDALSCYLMVRLLERTGQIWTNKLRHRAISRILDQPASFFSHLQTAPVRLAQTLERDAEETRNILGRFAAFTLMAAVMMTLSVTWSAVVCWKLTLVGFAVSPLSYGITRAFQITTARMEARSNENASAVTAILDEVITSIKTVRALTLERHFQRKYDEAVQRAYRVGVSRAIYSGAFYGLSEGVVTLTEALIFYYGATLVARQGWRVEDVMTVFMMLLFSMNNLNAIIGFIPQVGTSKDCAARLLRLGNLPLTSHEHAGYLKPAKVGDIALKDLHFSHTPQDEILKGITLTISHGKHTAIVGPSGSGKSTLTSLLLRLYPPNQSQTPDPPITLAATPLTSISTPHLRTLVRTVPQHPALLPGSIADNIAYPSNPTDHTAITTAARSAGIHDFVASLPDGYATLVSDGGTALSGGQTQRICVARALFQKPEVLLLDEATSALDAESAVRVRECVRRWDGTVVSVTHDVEMMRAADLVVVLVAGRVVETGRFGDLSGREGGFLRGMLEAGLDEGCAEGEDGGGGLFRGVDWDARKG